MSYATSTTRTMRRTAGPCRILIQRSNGGSTPVSGESSESVKINHATTADLQGDILERLTGESGEAVTAFLETWRQEQAEAAAAAEAEAAESTDES